MTGVETFVVTIAVAVAKHMVADVLGDNWTTQVGQDLLDLVRDAALDKKNQGSAADTVDEIARGIVAGMRSWVQVEMRNLDAGEGQLAIEEAARTLSSARISGKRLVELGVEPNAVAKYLLDLRPEASGSLSEDGTALYGRLLHDASQAIVMNAARFEDYAAAFDANSLAGQRETLRMLGALAQKPDDEVVAFERRYCEAVSRKLDRTELFGLPRLDEISRKQSLSIAYINLTFDAPEAQGLVDFCLQGGKVLEVMGRTVVRYRREVVGAVTKFLGVAAPTLQPAETATSATTRLTGIMRFRFVVRGKAGSGKTTLLQWLAMRVARSEQDSPWPWSRPAVPFFIRLRERVDKGFPAPEEFVKLLVPAIAGGMPDGWVHRVLDEGRALVLVDGVDEVPQAQRVDMLRGLQELVATYPSASYVVTSRPAAIVKEYFPEWAEWTDAEHLVTLEIQDMTIPQAERLIKCWHQALAETMTDSDERTEVLKLPDELMRQIQRRPELRRLTINPLLCAMLCAVHRERRQDLPSERAGLYHECVEILLNRRDPGRKVVLDRDYGQLTEKQKEKLAQSIAYWFLKNGYTDAPFAEVDQHFQSLLTLMDTRDMTGEQVRRFFVERTSLLREPVSQRVDFPHRTFQEYLAALAAVDASDFGLLKSKAKDDQWRETIILAAGEARPKERANFLKGLIAKADRYKRPDDRNRLYMLAAACLETKVELAADVRQLVLDRVRQTLPPLTDDEIQMIAKAGDPIVPLLGPDPDYSGEEAAGCIKALAQIGTPAALATISAFAYDSRYFVTEALGSAWQQFDRHSYLRQVLLQIGSLTLTQVPSADELAQLEKLESLWLEDLEVSDISAIASLRNLKMLDLGNVKVGNLSPLRGLTQLEELGLRLMRTPCDISVLRELPQLRSLHLVEPNVNDLTPLADLTLLTELWILRIGIEDLSVIAAMKSLDSLLVDFEQLDQLTLLRDWSNLRELFIFGDVDCATLSGMTGLQRLRIAQTGARNLKELRGLPKLMTLELAIPVAGLEFLAGLAGLKDLRLRLMVGSVDRSLPQALELPESLESLSLIYTEWEHGEEGQRVDRVDMSRFSHLPHLKKVNIEGLRAVRDLSALASLVHLEHLVVSASQARDLRPLANLPKLQRLEIWGSGRIDRQALSHMKDLVIERAR